MRENEYPKSPVRFPTLLPYEYFLIELGKNLLRARANIPRYVTDADTVSAMLGNVEGYIFDNKILYTDYDSFKYIVEKDWTSRIDFYSEVFDCDNFAAAFVTHINEVWTLNNVGIAIGKVFDAITDEMKFVHAWNIVLLGDKHNMELFAFEPQAKILMPYNNPVIGTLKYVPETVLWW